MIDACLGFSVPPTLHLDWLVTAAEEAGPLSPGSALQADGGTDTSWIGNGSQALTKCFLLF